MVILEPCLSLQCSAGMPSRRYWQMPGNGVIHYQNIMSASAALYGGS